MIIYLLVFLIVEILAIMCNKIEKNNKTTKIFAFLIVIILSIFAGVRDLTIGTDVNVYGANWFNIACDCQSFKDYISLINTTDIGYLVINYIVSRFTTNVNVFLFIIQLICNSLVIITLYRYRERCPFWLSLLTYLCIFYCRTFNILRQSIALSIVFYSIKYLYQNKNIKYLIAIMIASLFHYTAIFCVIILVLKKICESKSKYKNLYLFLIFLITILSVCFIKDVIAILYSIGLVNVKIYNYLFTFVNDNDVDLFGIDFFVKTLFLIAIYFSYKKINKKEELTQFLFFVTIMEFVIFQIKNIILYSDRIALYFNYFILLLLPQASFNISTKLKDRLIVNAFFSTILIIYWIYKYVYAGSCDVYPYTSNILGI